MIKEFYYHGSKSKIDKFTKLGQGKHGRGMYFTPDRNEASYFAKNLAGDGSSDLCRIYKVRLIASNPFNSMSVESSTLVGAYFGFKYKIPEFAGGAKEHYHHLQSQMKKRGIIESDQEMNSRLKEAGFDSVFYDLMEHLIVFDPDQVEIIDQEVIR